jgi:poly-gamma-glutamate capsule biosynthesis protein CapA/YwtB (metallophosphatase superfamily)
MRPSVRRRCASLLAPLLLLSAGCALAGPDAPSGGSGTEVTLTFGGDVHFQGRVAGLLANPGTTFGPVAPLLSAGDLAFVNLETPITDRGRPEPKRYLFRAGAQAGPALHAAGVDAVSLANNHSLDYGRQGLDDTIAAARAAGVGVIGAGKDADAAFTPWRATVRGVRVAVFGFSQVDDLADSWAAGPGRPGIAMAFDVDRAVAAVALARRDSDLIVVLPHWGTEGDRCPNRLQQDFAARIVAAGADVVVGAHAHVLQGAGRLGDGYVAYGLGNLLWYSSGLFPPFSARSGILTLTVRDRTVIRSDFSPVVVSDTGQPRRLTGWQRELARRNYAGLTACTGLTS